ncbi:MAG: T9SS type B sorting domain-containing protein [Bacteroidota bacterium]
MKYTITLLWFLVTSVAAFNQDISGFWQGVERQQRYNPDLDMCLPDQELVNFPLSIRISQTNDTVTGELFFQSEDRLTYFLGAMENSSFNNNILTIGDVSLIEEIGGNWCINFRADLSYSPIDQSLMGPWRAEPGPDASVCCPGIVEVYRLVVTSDTIFCPGEPIDLSVTGLNIRWYSDEALTDLVGEGNDFSPNISETTTFYVTQTHYEIQSPAFPVRVVIDPRLEDLVVEDTDCGDSNGSISVTSSSGFSLQYSLDGVNFQSENTFDSLSQGDYTVRVRNERGCIVSEGVFVGERPGPSIGSLEVQNANCDLDNGSVSVTASGGVGQIRYSLDGNTFSEGNFLDNLAPGSYDLFIRDQNGCGMQQRFTIIEDPIPEIQSLQIQGTTCRNSNGEVLIERVETVGTPEFSIDSLSFQSSSILRGLQAGEHVIYVRDANGCTISQEVVVPEAIPPTIIELTSENATCTNEEGSITVRTVGGEGQVQYALGGLNFQDTPIFRDLASGIYSISVRDENACIDEDTIQVFQDDPIVIDSISIVPSDCERGNGQISFHLSGGVGQLLTQVENAVLPPNEVHRNLFPREYRIFIFDEVGCEVDTMASVPTKNCPIYIPNSFSPNGDGINDDFVVVIHPLFSGKVKSFRIFDRWGKLLAEQIHPDPFNIKWDGQSEGKTIQETVLVYRVEIEYLNGGADSLEGSITITK